MGSRWIRPAGRVALLILIAVALQTLVFSHVTILGMTVDLFLIFTVLVAVSWGSLGGAVFGFAAGIAADVAYLEPLGMRAFACVLVGYVVGAVARRLRGATLWTVFIYVLASSFVAKLILGGFAFTMGPREGFFTMLGLQIIPGAVLDALVAVPILLLLLRLKVVALPRPEPTTGEGVSS
jgi:rod shape-determining protein MreD